MATINLFRIDTRLVHGQICTRWAKAVDINRIVVINNELMKDPFMSNIYKMSAPKGIKVEIMDISSAVSGWKANELGAGKLMVIVKDVISTYELYQAWFPIKEILIGNLIASTDNKSIIKIVLLNMVEFAMLKEIADSGVRIYIQNVPDHIQQSFSIIEKEF